MLIGLPESFSAHDGAGWDVRLVTYRSRLQFREASRAVVMPF